MKKLLILLFLGGGLLAFTLHQGYFEKNLGQWNRKVVFLGRHPNYNIWILRDSLVISSRDGKNSVALRFVRGKASKVSGILPLVFKLNYLRGNKRVKSVPTFKGVKLKEVWPGINLTFYFNEKGQLEFDVEVFPTSKHSEPRIKASAEEIEIKDEKIILMSSPLKFCLRIPKAILVQEDSVREVKVRFSPLGEKEFSFRMPDSKAPVVIDPLFIDYSTYSGGSNYDYAYGNFVDRYGNHYITGWTFSSDFPTTPGSFQDAKPGHWDAFLVKISKDGNTPIFATYIGGSSIDVAYDVVVDEKGYIYMGGATWSDDFPLKAPLQPVRGGAHDCFITELTPDGSSLVFSTYWGGSNWDWVFGLGLTRTRDIIFTGVTRSPDFPVIAPVQSSFGGGDDAILVKFSPDGAGVVFSTYLGGTGNEWGYGVASDDFGNVYISGWTDSPDFPIAKPFQGTIGGGEDAFFAKIKPTGFSMVFSSFLGGSGNDRSFGIDVDPVGDIYLSGSTDSPDFPLRRAFQSTLAGGKDGFITKIFRSGNSLIYSTYIGGSNDDEAIEIKINELREATVCGGTSSSDFPAKDETFSYNGSWDAFVLRLSRSGSSLVFSTIIGGSADEEAFALSLGGRGAIYIAGGTNSVDFPVLTPLQGTLAGSYDSFASKFTFNYIPIVIINGPKNFCLSGSEKRIPLDGRDSYDKDGRIVLYRWNLESKPAGSSAFIKAEGEQAYLYPDLPGKYEVSLRVMDNGGLWSKKTSFSLKVLKSKFTLLMEIFRGEESAWIIKKDYALITLRLKSGGPCGEKITLIKVKRKSRTEEKMVKEIRIEEFTSQGEYLIYRFYDKYLEKGESYIYSAEAYDSEGNLLIVKKAEI